MESSQSYEPEKPFACNYCNKRFSKKFILTLHIRSHTNERPYPCDLCDKRFPQKSDLTRHLRVHTGEKPFICDICLKRFNQRFSLTQHRRIHTGEKPFECPVCFRQFNKKASILEHVCSVVTQGVVQSSDGHVIGDTVITVKKKPFTCSVCPKQFSTKFCLIQHERTHKKGKKFQCDVCQKRFSYKSTLMKHDMSHAGLAPRMCDVCFKCFHSGTALKIHTCVKPDSESLEVPEVVDMFIVPNQVPEASDIIIEAQAESGGCSSIVCKTVDEPTECLEPLQPTDKEKPFVCSICSKSFKRKYILSLHMRSHTGLKPYICDECGKRFPQKSDLVRHERVHTGEKPYACDFCPKRFAQKPGMTQHRRTHTGERPFSCQTCFKTFNKKASVLEHCCVVPTNILPEGLTKPLKLKPFACGIGNCNKLFSTKFGLALHRRLHVSVPYVCTLCDKSFSYPSTLNKHLTSHLADHNFICTRCQETFTDKSLLLEHKCSIKPKKNSWFKNNSVLNSQNQQHGSFEKSKPFLFSVSLSSSTKTKFRKKAISCIKCHAVVEGTGQVCDVCQRTGIHQMYIPYDQSSEASDKQSSDSDADHCDSFLDLLDGISNSSKFRILVSDSVESYQEHLTEKGASYLGLQNEIEMADENSTKLTSSQQIGSGEFQLADISFVQYSIDSNNVNQTQKSLQIVAGASALLKTRTHLVCNSN